MSLPSLVSWETLLRHLPFHLYDTYEVNQTFSRWHVEHAPEDHKIITLWTYLYVYHYFANRLVQSTAPNVVDFEMLISQAYAKVEDKRTALDAQARYASWVSVICRNTFFNYQRRHRYAVPLTIHNEPATYLPTPEELHDQGIYAVEISDAIARLPSYLREVARLYFTLDLAYPDIAAHTGRPLPTIRTYIHRIMQAFQDDPALRALFVPQR